MSCILDSALAYGLQTACFAVSSANLYKIKALRAAIEGASIAPYNCGGRCNQAHALRDVLICPCRIGEEEHLTLPLTCTGVLLPAYDAFSADYFVRHSVPIISSSAISETQTFATFSTGQHNTTATAWLWLWLCLYGTDIITTASAGSTRTMRMDTADERRH